MAADLDDVEHHADGCEECGAEPADIWRVHREVANTRDSFRLFEVCVCVPCLNRFPVVVELADKSEADSIAAPAIGVEASNADGVVAVRFRDAHGEAWIESSETIDVAEMQ